MDNRQLSKRNLLQEVAENINWVYAILWEYCPEERSVVWGEGYYNGAPVESNPSKETVMPRSTWQQREARRQVLQDLQTIAFGPGADIMLASGLSSTEWFYLMTSSYTFPLGTYGTPAKTIVTGAYDWVADADDVSMLEFSRVDLAKAAGIKTVVSVSVHGGVVEIGTTALMADDLGIAQFVRSVFEKQLTDGINCNHVATTFGGTRSDRFRITREATMQSSGSVGSHDLASGDMENYLPRDLFSEGGSCQGLSLGTNTHTACSEFHQLAPFGEEKLSASCVGYNTDNQLEVNEMQESTSLENLPLDEQLQQQMLRDRLLHLPPKAHSVKVEDPCTPASSNMSKDSKYGRVPKFWRGVLLHQLGSSFTARPSSSQASVPVPRSKSSASQQCDDNLNQEQQSMGSLPTGPTVSISSQQEMPSEDSPIMDDSEPTKESDPSGPRQLSDDIPFTEQMQLVHSWSTTDITALHLPNSDPAKHTDHLRTLHAPERTSQALNGLNSERLMKRLVRTTSSCPEKGSSVKVRPILVRANSMSAGINRAQQSPGYKRSSTGQSESHSWSDTVSASPGKLELDVEAEDTISIWTDTLRQEGEGQDDISGLERFRKKAKGVKLLEEDSREVNLTHSHKQCSKLKEKFKALKASLRHDAHASEVDKESALRDTIDYLKDLQRRLSNKNESTTALASSPHQHNSIDTTPMLRFEDVKFDTTGLVGTHVTVDEVPHIEVRMMDNQQVMVRLSAKDRPGLFTDLMLVLHHLKLQVQHANICTTAGHRNDVFAAKIDVSLLDKRTTHDIAVALSNAIEGSCPAFTPDTDSQSLQLSPSKER